MLEKTTNTISYKNSVDFDFVSRVRDRATAKTLEMLLNDYEEYNATEKALTILNANNEIIEIPQNYKTELLNVQNALNELVKEQETLTYKAYEQKRIKLNEEKRKVIEKYAFLKTKVERVEYENTILLSEIGDLNYMFTKYVELKHVVKIILK